MHEFIRHLKSAWLFGRIFPYIAEAEEEDFWTEEDAVNLSRFLDSLSGRKLQMRMKNYCVNAAISAVKQQNNTKYHNGVASGTQIMVSVIEAHVSQPQPAEEAEPTGEEVYG